MRIGGDPLPTTRRNISREKERIDNDWLTFASFRDGNLNIYATYAKDDSKRKGLAKELLVDDYFLIRGTGTVAQATQCAPGGAGHYVPSFLMPRKVSVEPPGNYQVRR